MTRVAWNRGLTKETDSRVLKGAIANRGKSNNTVYPHTHKLRNGYPEIWCPEHPRNRGGYIYEHTLVMEKYIGRFLLPNEVVHHKDEDRSNAKIENLLLMQSSGDHTRLHKYMHSGKEVILQKTEKGSFICLKTVGKKHGNKVQITGSTHCNKCGNTSSINKTGLCRKCYLESGQQLSKKNIPSYEFLEKEHKNGVSYQTLADRYETSYQTIRSRIRKKITI